LGERKVSSSEHTCRVARLSMMRVNNPWTGSRVVAL
jgi:hypothetical protein